jgi:thiamine biosynthesis lipoprotein
MNTVMIHKVFGEHAEEALRSAEGETKRLEGLLSRFIPNSEISRINRFAGMGYETLSPDTYEVLSQAIEFSKCCKGCFDVTIGPIVTLWQAAKVNCKPPNKSQIRQILPNVDYTELTLNSIKRTASLKKIGQSIDLGGIGKGYAADKILDVFKKYGITSAFTNLGGNVAVIGAKPEGTPWRVGIRHPRKENELIGVVSVVNKAVVTSGDDQRYFFDTSGKRYHHILNPTTGYPSESGLISVTIISESSMTADALSTIVFIAGRKRGMAFLKSFPEIEAILIDINLQIHITKGLQDYFESSEGVRINILD